MNQKNNQSHRSCARLQQSATFGIDYYRGKLPVLPKYDPSKPDAQIIFCMHLADKKWPYLVIHSDCTAYKSAACPFIFSPDYQKQCGLFMGTVRGQVQVLAQRPEYHILRGDSHAFVVGAGQLYVQLPACQCWAAMHYLDAFDHTNRQLTLTFRVGKIRLRLLLKDTALRLQQSLGRLRFAFENGDALTQPVKQLCGLLFAGCQSALPPSSAKGAPNSLIQADQCLNMTHQIETLFKTAWPQIQAVLCESLALNYDQFAGQTKGDITKIRRILVETLQQPAPPAKKKKQAKR